MVLHTFPGPEAPAEAFTAPQPAERLLPGAYEDEIARQVKAGADETAARCGMLVTAN
jgi:hypothetical protein